MTPKSILHEALIAVKNRERKNPLGGICTHVGDFVRWNPQYADYYPKIEALLSKLLKQWPDTPADADLDWSPIPNYLEETSAGTTWKNPLRLQLLDWLIEATK